MAEMRLYSVREIAKMLKITRHGAYALIKSGQLKSHQFTERRTRITEADLNEFMRNSRKHYPAQENRPTLNLRCDCP